MPRWGATLDVGVEEAEKKLIRLSLHFSAESFLTFLHVSYARTASFLYESLKLEGVYRRFWKPQKPSRHSSCKRSFVVVVEGNLFGHLARRRQVAKQEEQSSRRRADHFEGEAALQTS